MTVLIAKMVDTDSIWKLFFINLSKQLFLKTDKNFKDFKPHLLSFISRKVNCILYILNIILLL